jgi:hypothetical protein
LLARPSASVPDRAAGALAPFPIRPTRYVLDAPLADLGTGAVVYRLEPHSVSTTEVSRFADALGLSGRPARTATGWEVQGANGTLNIGVVDDSTTVSYWSGAPGVVGGAVGSSGSSNGSVGSANAGHATANASTNTAPPVGAPTPALVPASTSPAPVDVPNATRAESIARSLLDRLGVLGGQQWTTNVSDTGSVGIACPVGVACPMAPPEVFARTVTFTRIIDGKSVDGTDWSVTFGAHAGVQSLDGTWATPANLGNYTLRSTAAVFTDLQHGTARFAGPLPMMGVASGAPVRAAPGPNAPAPLAVTVHISGVTLGLARWDSHDGGRTVADLVPTYHFHARLDGGASYDIVVLALDPNAITFTNPNPTPKPPPISPAVPASVPVVVSPPSS